MAEKDFKLEPGTNGESEVETQDELDVSYKKLSDLMGNEGTSMVTMSKQDMSLMKQILTAASEEFKEQMLWRMCDFIDEDEALENVNAYYESKDIGMDTGYNIAYTFSLTSAHRRTAGTNLISQMLGALQMSKWSPSSKKGNDNGHNPRSPIS